MNNDYLNPQQGDNPNEDISLTEAPADEIPTEAEVAVIPENDATAQNVTASEEPVAPQYIDEQVTADSETINAEEPALEMPFAEEVSPAETVQTEAPTPQPTPAPVYQTPQYQAPYQAPQYQAPYQAPQYQAPYQAPHQAPPYQAPNSNPVNTQPQYYYGNQPNPQPPKKKKGHVAFLICLWSLIGVFAMGFFVLCGYVVGHNSDFTGSTAPTFFNETQGEETEPVTDSTKEETPDGVIALPDNNENVYSSDGNIDLRPVPSDSANKDKYTTQYAYKKVAESTIGVVCYEKGFTGEPASQGTGIVITKDGYIATNSHVIGDSRTAYSVQVVTNDGTTYEAKVIGFDSRTDLAVLKVNADNLIPAEFCDSDLVEVGIDVIAVGNPGGMDFQNSLTRGVVSALNRELGLSAQVTYIQTDAAINPGNSGGPLSNMYGQVIGITTAKISSESVEGMGFAIPSRTVKDIIDDLMSQGYVSNRVRLGISGQAVSSSMQQYYNLPGGILIGEIAEDGPCYNTGLKVNDIITKIDSEEITDFADVYEILGKHKPGDKVVLSIYRKDTAKTFDVTITLAADEGQTQQ